MPRPRSLAVAIVLGLLAMAWVDPAGAALRAKFERFVHDVDESARFYETLGFTVAHRKPSDGYTTLRSGDVVVALSPLPRWLPVHWLGFLRLPPFGTEIVFYPDSLADARAALVEAGYRPGAIERQSWG
ncbi:MAG: hypothetical protein HKP30_01635, partial [Myxococcales bacterium]|nr:hypothetical protein [Myxococcales bacterium]